MESTSTRFLGDGELLGGHRPDEVKGWVERLRYFSYLGLVQEDHFQQNEELVVYLRFDGRDDLVRMLDQFGVLAPGDGRPPSPVAGEGPYNIASYPDLLEPRDCTVAGVACNIEVPWGSPENPGNTLIIHVREDEGGVTGQRVADAQKLETLLDEFGFAARIIPLKWDYVVRADQFA